MRAASQCRATTTLKTWLSKKDHGYDRLRERGELLRPPVRPRPPLQRAKMAAHMTAVNRKEDIHRKARELVEQFFISLQQDVKGWLSLGTTKTGMVYRLKGNAAQSHE